MGFFELLHIPKPEDVQNSKNTRFLPFISGNIENRNDDGLHAKNLREKIEEVAGIEIKGHLLFTGLTEAITNVSHHAYKSHNSRKSRWWMSGAFDKIQNEVIVSFYDHGLTIPKTLPSSKYFEKIREWFRFWSDSEKIKAAMKYGRTSTGELARGKGLQDFLAIIRAYPNSELKIYSRKGLLMVRNVPSLGAGKLKFTCKDFEISLRGTLIEWRFSPLQKDS